MPYTETPFEENADELANILSVWKLLGGEDIPDTSSASIVRPRSDSCLEFGGRSHMSGYSPPVCPWSRSSLSFDETASTLTGGSRTMSIFESMEEVHPCSVPTPKILSPMVSGYPTSPESTIASLSHSTLMSPGSDRSSLCGGGKSSGDKANAEASTLIKEYGRKGDLSSCWGIWNNLVASSMTILIPNEITLGCMVDALVSNQEVEHAESLVNQWKYQISPNTVVYSTLIHGWAKQNDAKRALVIFNQMQTEGVPCNAVTYNCMIHACVRVGDMQGALDLLYSMGGSGVAAADKFTYSTIIKGYCGRGEIENALFLFDEMLQHSLTPDLVIYNTLLDGCVKTRFHEVCDKLLDDMVNEWGISPNSYTLSILIKRFGRQGDLLKAFELVEQLPRQYAFRANAHVWTCLISACVSQGRLATAECVFAAMSGRRPIETNCESPVIGQALQLAGLCPPDAKTYETLALGCARYGHTERATALVREGMSKFKLSAQCADFLK